MTQQRLIRLKSGARTLLDDNPDFLKGKEGAKWLDDSELERFTESTDYTADLNALKGRLEQVKEDYKEYDGEMDTEAAVAVHEEIKLTKSAASDSGIWNALAINHFPWFVRHRWKYESKNGMKEKFWTAGTPLDSRSSTFERLWWIAELTQEDGNYDNTRRVFKNRRFCFRVFDIQIGRYKPAVLALLEVLYDEEEDSFAANDVIDETVQRLRRAGSTVPLEGRTESELITIVENIRNDVEEDLS